MNPSQARQQQADANSLDQIALPSLLTTYPHSRRFRLSNKTRVFLPVHQRDFNYIVLGGTAPLRALDKVLKAENLEAVPFAGQPGYGEVQLYAIKYLDGDAGAYGEFFEVFLVRDKPIDSASVAVGSPYDQYFVRRAYVSRSAQKAIAFGIEVWGYPKKPGTIDHSIVQRHVSFKCVVDGKTAISASSEQAFANPTDITNRFTFITPYEIRRSYAGVINTGKRSLWVFDKTKNDVLSTDKSTVLGSDLHDLQFKPTFWAMFTHMKAVGFSDTIPADDLLRSQAAVQPKEQTLKNNTTMSRIKSLPPL